MFTRALSSSIITTLLLGFLAGSLSPARAAVSLAGKPPKSSKARPVRAQPPPPTLHLAASAPIVDVGGDVVFTLAATKWPAPASIVLQFVSPHHGFTGPMVWEGGCRCFRIAVRLARRIHSLEQARATAVVSYHGRPVGRAYTTFMIRGLAANGRDFAPGGRTILTTWVSMPRPTDGQYQHFCIWARTLDQLGVAGLRVHFVVHYREGTRSWNAGTTGRTGVVCSHKSIGHAQPDRSVKVDAYVGRLHATTSFTPRA